MTNKEILRVAMEQSALDINCSSADFLCDHPVIVRSGVGKAARKYYKEPIACNLVLMEITLLHRCGTNFGILLKNT